MMSLQYGMADFLPALAVLKHLPILQFYIRELAILHMGILVELHLPAIPHREVGALDPIAIAMLVGWVEIHGRELQRKFKRRLRPGQLAGGVKQGEPVLDELPRSDPARRNADSADSLGAEEVVILHCKLDGGGAVGQGDDEVLLPDGELGVGYDAGASHGGAGDHDGDVGVAGDDPMMGVSPIVGGGLVFLLRAAPLERSPAGGEAPPQVLGEGVHVGQSAGLAYPQLEVAMEHDDLPGKLGRIEGDVLHGRLRRRREDDYPEPVRRQ